eukprot:8631488-Pyramimonas_sp.AAC.1
MPRGFASTRDVGSTQRKGLPMEASWSVLGASWRSRAPLKSFWEPLGGLLGACWGLPGPGRVPGPS